MRLGAHLEVTGTRRLIELCAERGVKTDVTVSELDLVANDPSMSELERAHLLFLLFRRVHDDLYRSVRC